MVNDYFQQYLLDDFNSLDKELSGTKWFQKQEEMEQQKMMNEERQQSMPEKEDNTPGEPATSDPFRPTYDRRNSTESKKDRLERIKEEYKHKPFISVGAWENLRKRRDKRKQVEKRLTEEMPKEGLSANSPSFTQLIEQNDPTTMPLSSMGSVKGFCKKAAFGLSKRADFRVMENAYQEIEGLSERGTLNKLSELVLVGKKMAECFDKQLGEMLLNPNLKLLPPEYQSDFIKTCSEFIRGKINALRVTRTQWQDNVDVAQQLDRIIDELEQIRGKYGL